MNTTSPEQIPGSMLLLSGVVAGLSLLGSYLVYGKMISLEDKVHCNNVEF